jgi:hypothetical protein
MTYGISILIDTNNQADLQALANVLTVFRDQSSTVKSIVLSKAVPIAPRDAVHDAPTNT